MNIRVNAPTKIVFYISAILAVVGVLSAVGMITSLAEHAFWIQFFAYAVLAFGCLVKGA